MFVDHAKIYVKAGDGGNGCISFRREKGVPRGGPNGGDGGKGGDILIRAKAGLSTLLDLQYQQQYFARRAAHGQGKDKHGKDSPAVVIAVPVGTIIKDAETREVLADLVEEGQHVVAARGGRGGRGNAAFATSTHRAPVHAEKGEAGEERWLDIELKLLADVGLVGLPNAGKSTLLSVISAARPKVAAYPFTTLTPHLGVVSWTAYKSFVVADIPGLIEGAHEGKGLGFQFLRHIERTSFLVFLIDISDSAEDDPLHQLRVVRSELRSYSPLLASKPFAVCATKMDIKGSGEKLSRLSVHCRERGHDFLSISAVTREGIAPLLMHLGKRIEDMKAPQS